MSSVRLLLTFALLPFAALLAADLRPAAVFSDHMVLQRDKPVPVWGWAGPGEAVTVAFAGQTKTATADAAGKWTVQLDPLPASAEGRLLTITSAPASHQVAIQDVLVGEVWLGSGQSNMAMTVSRALNPEAEAAASNLPLIRMFRESSTAAPAPQEDATGSWTVCAPETVGGFSATLFFFGREIHRALGVPVGLLNSSVGGTPIESWIALEAQQATPALKEFVNAGLAQWNAFDPVKAQAAYEKARAAHPALAAKAKEQGRPVPRAPRNPVVERQSRGGLGGLFNGKIAPLIPYALRGAVWYQGEANTHPGKSHLYEHHLPLLVTDWRARWGEEFPFAWAQLPNFTRPGEGWPRVREAMLKTLSLPHTGMAITIDVGDPADIHPANKQEVGRRLSLWALGEVYGQTLPATSGPLLSSHEIRGPELAVTFRHTAEGLLAKDGDLRSFTLAGTDRQWHPAQARIEGETVLVSSPAVPQPVAARYSWSDNPDGNLVNSAGLPASPFRTDDWTAATP